MRHCSVQVRGLLTREELDRYNGLIEAGSYLEDQSRYDLAYHVQKEIDVLILPAIERLKDKGRPATGQRLNIWRAYGKMTRTNSNKPNMKRKASGDGELFVFFLRTNRFMPVLTIQPTLFYSLLMFST